MEEKKVSVILPAYNCEKFVRAAVISILNQSYRNLEILIADDASTDATKEIINSIIDQRISLYHNLVNLGYPKTVNKLLSLSSGDYITFQDADDWSDLNRIKEQVAYLEDNKIEVCGTGIYFTSDKGKISGKQIYPIDSHAIKVNAFKGKPNVCHASLLFTRNVLECVGVYRTFFKYGAEDVDWFYRIIEKYNCLNIDKCLYYYRFLPSSITQSISILKQKASLMLAKDMAKERILQGSDSLQDNNIRIANLLWEKHYNSLKQVPLSEEIHKQNRLLRKHANLECLRLWWKLLPMKGPISLKTSIIIAGIIKILIGVDNYQLIKVKIINIIHTKKFIKGIALVSGHIKSTLYMLIAFSTTYFEKHSYGQKECWIVGENYGVYLDDNGYQFFKYCRNEHPEIDVYFVTKKISLIYNPELSLDKNVLIYGSPKHIRKLVSSDVIIFSHTPRDIVYKYICPLIDRNKVKVFLQHGVTAFKKFNREYLKNKNYIDIMLATSDYEKKILIDNVGVTAHKIKITGFPRFDNLMMKTEQKNQILYMPTWRDWANDDFFLTDFYRKTQSLLNNSLLSDTLRAKNVIMKLYLHKNMADKLHYFTCLNSDVMKLIALGEETVQSLIKKSSLMITDYSSVAWDFLYLKKPLILYQYDIDAYQKFRGSYIDFNEFELGKVLYDEPSLIDNIVKYINSHFAISNIKSELHRKYFKYSDKDNSQRVFTEIQNAVKHKNN